MWASAKYLFAAAALVGDLPLVNAQTAGNAKWTFQTGDQLYATAVLDKDGTALYIGSLDHKVYKLDPETGDELWATPFVTNGDIFSAGALSPDQSTFFVGSDDFSVYAIDTATGLEKWSFETDLYVEAPPVVSRDGSTIYIGSWDSNVYALDAETGDEVWRITTGTRLDQGQCIQ